MAGAKLIVVLGHANSAVMRMAVEAFLTGRRVADATRCAHLDPIVAEVQKTIDPRRIERWESLPPPEQQACLDDLYRAYVLRVIDRILHESVVLRGLVEVGQLKAVGGMYDVRSGRIDFFESSPATPGSAGPA